MGTNQPPAHEPQPADLERKLADAFPNEGLREAARAQLLRYGREGWHHEPGRVRLAILKLAGSDLVALGRFVESAGVDYRDILSMAEYPAYSKLPPGIDPMSAPAQEAMRADERQYLEWLESH